LFEVPVSDGVTEEFFEVSAPDGITKPTLEVVFWST